MAQLSAPYHWQESENGAFLNFNYACVAYVRSKRPGDRRCQVVVYSTKTLYATAASVEQGKRHLERWVAKQWRRFPPMGR